MIKENQKHFNRLHVVLDAFVIVIAYLIAWVIKFLFLDQDVGALPFRTYAVAILPIVPVYLFLYYLFSLYTPKRVQGRRLEMWNIVKANTVGIALILGVLYLIKMMHFSRELLAIFYFVNILMETGLRNLIRYFLRSMRKKGYNLKHILLVGYSHAAEEYIDRIIANPQWGYKIRGILDDHIEAGTEYKGVKVLGRIANLMVILPQNHLDEIAITLGLNEYYRLEEIVALCEKSGVHTKFIPDYNRVIPTKPYTEDILGLPVINIRHVPLTNTYYAVLKRMMDIVGSLCAIVIFSPVMLFSVIMIKLTSPGPLIFKQERVGLHNQPFMMYKFRSMEVQAPEKEKTRWTVKDDPRVTGFGKFMRKTSIDELPQLFNVLAGDMSMVGPRPERREFIEDYSRILPEFKERLRVKGGLTGYAQIYGKYSTGPEDKLKYDLIYIYNYSLRLDIRLLFLTIRIFFQKENAQGVEESNL